MLPLQFPPHGGADASLGMGAGGLLFFFRTEGDGQGVGGYGEFGLEPCDDFGFGLLEEALVGGVLAGFLEELVLDPVAVGGANPVEPAVLIF